MTRVIDSHTPNARSVSGPFWNSDPTIAQTTLERCSYGRALATIGSMKGMNMIEVDRDDSLISALMHLPAFLVDIVRARYSREDYGYPTVEALDALLTKLGGVPEVAIAA